MSARGIGRRRFLGGAGVAVALPFLPSLVRPAARADVEGVPKRLLAYYVPNGIVMSRYTPSAAGRAWPTTPILAPLEAHRDDVIVVTGLANRPARPDGPGDHAAGTGSFITCTHVNKSESEIENAISMDQVVANAFGECTRFPSLQVGTEGGGSTGGCDSGYSCAYSRNISWAGPTTPLPKIVDPRVLFDRMFAGFDAGETEAERAKRQLYRRSVLDYAFEEAQRLDARLGRDDQLKLEEYLNAVREVELGLDGERGTACEVPERPERSGDLGYQDHMRLMTELMVLAFQCDQTRVISYMLGNAGSGRVYSHLGVRDGHHQISHHSNDPANIDALTLIDTFEVEQLALLVRRLSEITESDGSRMLDNTIVFWSSEIEDGDAHRHTNMPILLAGSAQGVFDTGQHVVFSEERPVADLLVTIMQAMDVDVDSFGDDGTGPLPGLTV